MPHITFPETFPVLNTTRMTLRQVTRDDQMSIFANFSDAEVSGWFLDRPLEDPKQALEFIDKFQKDFRQGNGITWAITFKGQEKSIGTCGFDAVRRDGVGELGFDLSRDQWGSGLMRECLSTILVYGFGKMGLTRVEADILSHNIRARNLLEKLGFQLERVENDRHYYFLNKGAMDHNRVREYWNKNADAWTHLARAGYDTYRNHLNTPAFLDMLPDVRGLNGVDIGCGEGYNTRLLAEKGAHMTALDISDVFVHHAHRENASRGLDIRSLNASAVELPFASLSFDFAAAFMSLMDIAETEQVISEAFRVLKPGGFLQFSIMHPSYDTPHRVKLEHENGIAYAYEVGDYFHEMQGEVQTWQFSAAIADDMKGFEPFQIPRFTRTLSHWINLLMDSGFQIERIAEPRPSDQVVAEHPNLQDAQVVPYFLIIRVRKPV